MFKNPFKTVTKPAPPKPQPTVPQQTNWNVSTAHDKRPADGCLTETLPNGKPWAYTLVDSTKAN
jgi:hypothetical protein